MKPIKVVDDRGARITLEAPPERIVSLVPSDTYSLVRLGAQQRLVGRTRYCVAPLGDVESIEVVGGTKDANVDRIVALAPDLVIANQEENAERDIGRLEAAGVRVLVSFPRRVAAGVAHFARLSLVLGLDQGQEPARGAIASAYHALRAAEAACAALPSPPVRVFVPIWMDPLMTVNQDTFISDMLALAGGENVFAARERRYPLAAERGAAPPSVAARTRDLRYPRVTYEEVMAMQPELVLLPDEPHPFSEADAALFRALAIPAATRGAVRFCDGKDLMWYGARAVEGIERLRNLVQGARG